jgi:predicted DsbA family dithiol-disulfide isomerase
VRIDVWSDLTGPTSWELRANLRDALAQFPHAAHVLLVDHAFESDRHADAANTFDAHRVAKFAQTHGVGAAVTDHLMSAGSSGTPLGDRATLVSLASTAGLDPAEVSAMLDSDDYGYQVREDEAIAAEIGITQAPFVVLDQKYALSGTRPVEELVNALAQVWEDRGTAPTERESGGCGGGSCGECMYGA